MKVIFGKPQKKMKEMHTEYSLSGGIQTLVKFAAQTLLDLRGSIPVSGEQDFDAIRKQVLAKPRKQA